MPSRKSTPAAPGGEHRLIAAAPAAPVEAPRTAMHREPDHADRPEPAADAAGAAPLHHEEADQHDQGEIGTRRYDRAPGPDHLQPLHRREHRDRRRQLASPKNMPAPTMPMTTISAALARPPAAAPAPSATACRPRRGCRSASGSTTYLIVTITISAQNISETTPTTATGSTVARVCGSLAHGVESGLYDVAEHHPHRAERHVETFRMRGVMRLLGRLADAHGRISHEKNIRDPELRSRWQPDAVTRAQYAHSSYRSMRRRSLGGTKAPLSLNARPWA